MEKVNEEERRACNLMMYGAEESEEDDEHCGQLIADIFEDMDCSSNVDTVDCYRIGKKETGKTRPIRIECKSRDDV